MRCCVLVVAIGYVVLSVVGCCTIQQYFVVYSFGWGGVYGFALFASFSITMADFWAANTYSALRGCISPRFREMGNCKALVA